MTFGFLLPRVKAMIVLDYLTPFDGVPVCVSKTLSEPLV